MDSLLLRIDWYSFLIGSQVSSLIGIHTLSAYDGVKLQFPREYLYPSVHNGGDTIFLFRIKEPGNYWKVAPKLHFRIFEKYIIGGFLYTMFENHYKLEDSIAGAFLCGGALGAYSCFSFQNGWPTDILRQYFLYSLSSAVFASTCQFVKNRLVAEGIVKASSFNLSVSIDLVSFSVGATLGYLIGLYCGHFTDNFEPILLPEIEDSDSSWEVTLKATQVLSDICCCLLKLYVRVEERLLVGGALYCSTEGLAEKILGFKSHFITTPLCGAILGSYFGQNPRGNPRRIALVSSAIACISRYTWSHASTQEDLTELLTNPLKQTTNV
ncbi:unnamed protein product [Orchesella dallaii]|uniref:Transmembrane protein n=1 Tax=Orchesella dallaii TaxID=48710 RepID=A0ABP1QEQ8_9HEXA